MNIFEKMSAISSEIAEIAKTVEVDDGSNTYKAVSEADVLKAVKPLENKYKVYSYPCSREIVGNASNMIRIKSTYRFVNVECPSEYIEVDSFGDGIDKTDKAPGKAMTYADKYALLKAYKIQTGDDPDVVEACTEEKPTKKEKAEKEADKKKKDKKSPESKSNDGITEVERKTVWSLAMKKFQDGKKIEDYLKSKKVSLETMTKEQYVKLVKELS